jgi:serine/threonine-protein kinase HipA
MPDGRFLMDCLFQCGNAWATCSIRAFKWAALLYQPGGIEFAPLYDLLCTVAYPEVHAKLAMKVGKRATLDQFTSSTWTDFADEIGMSAPFVRRRASALAELILGRVEEVANEISAAGFDGPDLPRFVEVIHRRARTLLDLGSVRRA